MPQILGISMHGVQKRASDSGHIYARGAETCPRFWTYLCTRGRDMSQIQGISMHGVQSHAPDSRHIYARGVEPCPRFKAYLCTECRNMNQVQGILMHMVQNVLPDFSRFFGLWRWSVCILSKIIGKIRQYYLMITDRLRMMQHMVRAPYLLNGNAHEVRMQLQNNPNP